MELDRSLLPILTETLGDRDNVEIVSGDILKLDIPSLVRERFQGLEPIACANLPYNITTLPSPPFWMRAASPRSLS